ncbi:MAG: hypothetical protein IKE28_11895 [Solobacterium sp.]|nr:hypothetical protein [Solobacterium sp.]
MQITAKLNINIPALKASRGLDKGGKVQQFIDNECIRLMDDYTPDLNGILKASIRLNTVIGSGKLVQATPYARYQYYGMLMVDPITLKGSFYDPRTGRHWSRPGVSKIMDPQGRKLNHNTGKSPKAGPHWFERMVADRKEDIGRGAAAIAGARYVK